MNLDNSLPKLTQILPLSDMERWEVYHRLQSLQIPCQCSSHQPLQVCIDTPSDVLQVWSVIRQIRSNRPSLVNWLDTCWQATLEIN